VRHEIARAGGLIFGGIPCGAARMLFAGEVRPVKVLKLTLTLLLAAAVGAVLWQRLEPRTRPLAPAQVQPKPFDPAWHRMSVVECALTPLAPRFDHPLGSEHGALTYNAQPFRVARHLGDDLNGIGGGNSDLGDPVYAAGTGLVVLSRDGGPGWGNVVILAHRVADAEAAAGWRIVQTMYAHLDEILVRRGETVRRGAKIGTVGTAGGRYLAHLHFEVRIGPYVNPGTGYADQPMNRVSPERFLREFRGAPEDLLNPDPLLDADASD
jgi:hypothetical protein